MTKKVYILCAAIWLQDGKQYDHQPKNIESGYVICGRRHHNCFATRMAVLKSEGKELIKDKCVQGFLTSDDRFVDRKEGKLICKEINQGIHQEKEILYSEHLY